MHDLTAFQRDQLFVIAGLDGARGVAVNDELGKYYMSDIKSGRLYPNLNSLVDKGLITKQPINDRANSYAPTKRGLGVLEDRYAWEREYFEPIDLEPSLPAAGIED